MIDKSDFRGAWFLVKILCLADIVNRMVKVHKWPLHIADIVSIQYRNYLLLRLLYPNIDLPPSREIDEFWHNHILHTQKYHKDCESIFGYYLHHNPHSNMDNINLPTELFEKNTQELYKKHFGDYLYVVYKKLYRRSFYEILKEFIKKKKS